MQWVECLHKSWNGKLKIIASQSIQLEHRLPMLYMLVPDIYSQYSANLRANQYKLTTAYDLYATLKELAGDNNIPSWSKSLFQEIPGNRLCEDAGIPLQYCSCDFRQQRQHNKSLIPSSEAHWNCAYNGEMGCDCTINSCAQREGKEFGRLSLPLWEL